MGNGDIADDCFPSNDYIVVGLGKCPNGTAKYSNKANIFFKESPLKAGFDLIELTGHAPRLWKRTEPGVEVLVTFRSYFGDRGTQSYHAGIHALGHTHARRSGTKSFKLLADVRDRRRCQAWRATAFAGS